MSHVVESATSRRHRRNRRTAIILVVLVAVLAGAGVSLTLRTLARTKRSVLDAFRLIRARRLER